MASGSLGDRAARAASDPWLTLKLGETVNATWVMAPQALKHIVSFLQVPTSDIPGTAAALLSTMLYSAYPVPSVHIYIRVQPSLMELSHTEHSEKPSSLFYQRA